MLRYDEIEVPSRTCDLSVLVTGSGPAVMLLHGITGNARVWDPIAAQLGESFTVLALDQRGHGKSGRGADGYGSVEFSNDIVSVIEAFDCDKALLVGHSLGARNAIVAAARFPEEIAGVVALDFTPFIESEVLDELQERVNRGNRIFENVDEVRSYLRSRYPNVLPDAIERRLEYGYVRDPDGGFRPRANAEAIDATARGLRGELGEFLDSCAPPMLMVRGGESRLVSAAAFSRTRQSFPQHKYAVIEGVDHYIIETVPDEVVRIVREFWNKYCAVP